MASQTLLCCLAAGIVLITVRVQIAAGNAFRFIGLLPAALGLECKLAFVKKEREDADSTALSCTLSCLHC
jgi:hypothetical protein